MALTLGTQISLPFTSAPWGLSVSSDGHYIFIGDDGPRYLYRLYLPTAFDLSSATTYTSISTSSWTNYPNSSATSADGTKLILLSSVSPKLLEFTLSTPWLLSSRTYVQSYTLPWNYPYSMAVSPDGLKVFVGYDNDGIEQYTLGSAWSLSSPTLTHTWDSGETFLSENLYGLAFQSSGTTLYSATGDKIYSSTLGTAYALSTATGGTEEIVFADIDPSYTCYGLASADTDVYALVDTGSGFDILEFLGEDAAYTNFWTNFRGLVEEEE